MAIVKIPAENLTVREDAEVTAFLASHGIDYERWVPEHPVAADASSDALLAAYGVRDRETESARRLRHRRRDRREAGHTQPRHDARKFSREHFHDEDEVRFIHRRTRGCSTFNPPAGPVFAIEVEAGDLIRVPRGNPPFGFDLCAERRIPARYPPVPEIVSGWTPHYTDSGVDKGFQPLCFGPTYVSAGSPAKM
jgi:1,2-dihydroxy-3-keto-5-methylthiopentene dioxygenase